MSNVLKTSPKPAFDRPGWIPPDILHDWDTNPYAYQTEEELMPGGGLHGQLLAYIMELLRATLKARGLMLLLDTFMLYRDEQGIKQRIAPDLLLMPFRYPPPSAYDLDTEPPPLCVLEVTSPKSHMNDLEKKLPFYLGFGISTYSMIDAITSRSQLREQIELHVWQSVDGQPRKMAADTEGRLALPEMGLRMLAEGQRIIFVDETTAEVLCDSEQLSTALQEERQALQAERQALQAERQALQAEQQAHLKTTEAYRAETRRADAEAEARRTVEAELARLKALLAKKE